jgi:ferredoxin
MMRENAVRLYGLSLDPPTTYEGQEDMKIHVDTRACSGHARCWATAANVYRINDDGYNDSDDYEVGPDELADASRGALACPEHAITLVDRAGNEVTEADLRTYADLPVS